MISTLNVYADTSTADAPIALSTSNEMNLSPPAVSKKWVITKLPVSAPDRISLLCARTTGEEVEVTSSSLMIMGTP